MMQRTAPWPAVCLKGMPLLVWVMVFWSGVQQAGACRPVCSGDECVTVNRDRLDFHAAEAACRGRSGQLMTFHSEADTSTLNLLEDLHGDFWVGLRLPASACSNLSAPLRGYEWTSGPAHGSLIPSSSTWRDRVTVCSPSCVSLSGDRKWTERPCADTAAGFLCQTKRKDACQAQGVSKPTGPGGCAMGPCEQECNEVRGGHRCSCFSGYIPDSLHPERCKVHCAEQRCPAVCDRGGCLCADGFIYDSALCEDIDECAAGECDQECTNTFGSFTCSCRDGFVLRVQVECVRAKGSDAFTVTTPHVFGSINPATDNDTRRGSSVPAGGFLWLWVLGVVIVAVSIVLVRVYVVKRQQRREQTSDQQTAADNVEI